MILVDTSIWIDLLTDPSRIPDPEAIADFAICGPIVQEVLQGFSDHASSLTFRERLLTFPQLNDPISTELFVEAAEIYRQGRRKGYTIRSSVDCLIAAIAIQNDVAVWHRDRDFTTIAKFTPLRAVTRYLT